MGSVSEAGWECLSESARVTPRVYPEFDYVICYNSLDEKQLRRLRSFGIPLHEQKSEDIGVPHEFTKETTQKVQNHAWKLCPLRLRPEAHEVWIDNDIIIWDRIEEIDEFLLSDKPIVSQTWSRELYGSFDEDVPDGCSICAGFFGLPPNYPFEEKIKEMIFFKGPLSGYDEQGMIASMITNNDKGWIGIAPYRLNQLGWWAYYKQMPQGGHFIRLNTGTNSGWETYKMLTHPSPKIVNCDFWEYKEDHIKNRGPRSRRQLFCP